MIPDQLRTHQPTYATVRRADFPFVAAPGTVERLPLRNSADAKQQHRRGRRRIISWPDVRA